MTRLLMTADAVGGVWTYATELAVALKPHGIETLLAVLGPAPTTPVDGIEVIDTGLPLDWVAADAASVVASGRAISALAARLGVDLVQLNSPALAAQARFAMPVVAVAHGCIDTWWRGARGGAPDPAWTWHGELMAAGLAAADRIVAPSAAFAAMLQASYALPTAPDIVYNGRTLPPVAEGMPADAVLTAGRLWDEAKAIPLLDQAAALIDAPFRAAGPVDGPAGEHVATRHLELLGRLDGAALAAEFAQRPIYASAALFEPFGLAVLEAAGAGCPLVLSDIDTFRELWGGAALIVGDETPDAYAAAIERLRADADLRAHLGEAARLRAARYTPAAMAESMAALYADCLAQPAQVEVAA